VKKLYFVPPNKEITESDASAVSFYILKTILPETSDCRPWNWLL